MNKITNAFGRQNALIPFVTCGDPDLAASAAIVRALVKHGADMIALGIPFSDPTAEGPVVQAANLRALTNGTTTDAVFHFVKRLRNDVTIPMVFVTYANVVFSYGAERFISTCAEIGIEGIVLFDLPYEEKNEFLPLCRQYGVKLISLITPAPAQRIAMIAKEAEGFIYMMIGSDSSSADSNIVSEPEAITRIIRENTQIPCAICMEQGSAELIGDMASIADGAIIGSAFVRIIEQHGQNAAVQCGGLMDQLRSAL